MNDVSRAENRESRGAPRNRHWTMQADRLRVWNQQRRENATSGRNRDGACSGASPARDYAVKEDFLHVRFSEPFLQGPRQHASGRDIRNRPNWRSNAAATPFQTTTAGRHAERNAQRGNASERAAGPEVALTHGAPQRGLRPRRESPERQVRLDLGVLPGGYGFPRRLLPPSRGRPPESAPTCQRAE